MKTVIIKLFIANNMATRSGKFNLCYFADGLMWCQFKDGTWAKPFKPSDKKAKDSPKKDESNA